MAVRCCERPRTAAQGLASLRTALARRRIGLASLCEAFARRRIGLASLCEAFARRRIGLASLCEALARRRTALRRCARPLRNGTWACVVVRSLCATRAFPPATLRRIGVTRPTLSRCLGEGWPWRDAEESARQKCYLDTILVAEPLATYAAGRAGY